jgi:hypothetical protein
MRNSRQRGSPKWGLIKGVSLTMIARNESSIIASIPLSCAFGPRRCINREIPPLWSVHDSELVVPANSFMVAGTTSIIVSAMSGHGRNRENSPHTYTGQLTHLRFPWPSIPPGGAGRVVTQSMTGHISVCSLQ